MKVFLDVDGVFAGWTEKVKSLHPNFTDYNDDELWGNLEQYPHLFRNLAVLPGSLKLVTMLQHHDLEFLTALPKPTGNLATADQDKREWIAENISRRIKVNTVLGGKNKYKWLESNPGAVLIDDYGRNCRLWAEHGGIAIQHKSPAETLRECERLGLL